MVHLGYDNTNEREFALAFTLTRARSIRRAFVRLIMDRLDGWVVE